jgi:hypothetical protein
MQPQVRQLATNVAIALNQLEVSDPETVVYNLLNNRQPEDRGCTLFTTEYEGDVITLRIGPSRYEFEPVAVFGRAQKLYCISGIIEVVKGEKKEELRPGSQVVAEEGDNLSGTAWSNFTVVEVNRSQSMDDGDTMAQVL